MSRNYKESGSSNRARAIAIPAPKTWGMAEIAGLAIVTIVLSAMGVFIWALLHA